MANLDILLGFYDPGVLYRYLDLRKRGISRPAQYFGVVGGIEDRSMATTLQMLGSSVVLNGAALVSTNC